MKDRDKTEEQLIEELMELRRRIAISEPEKKQLEEQQGVKIGEILIELDYLTKSQLERYLEKQKAETLSHMFEQKKRKIGEIMVESELITTPELLEGLTEQLRRLPPTKAAKATN